ncbi:MAG TPA: polysaccharide deacetylase family protein [Gemmatimonadales bacterium]|nr:polysaccharide deacetylase family protein [Gemmatimonadales bacterium]
MAPERPVASISLDLDDLWTYLRTRGDPAWESRPSYLGVFMPRMLDLLGRLDLRITFFVVGFDATREANAPHFRALAEHGHEIGNHSFWHECWLQRYSAARLDEEIARAHEALHAATGQTPVGFRGPGFSWSPELFEVLARRGYVYDASTLPTFLGPLARLYFLASAKLSARERAERAALFGAFRDGFRPNQPYTWQLADQRRLVEVPVTTVPVVRTPFHMSYLLYLSRFSTALMRGYLRLALSACRTFGVEPSFLIHPLDLLGGDDVTQLDFFPGMDLTSARKAMLVAEVLGVLREQFDLITVRAHAERALADGAARPGIALAA